MKDGSSPTRPSFVARDGALFGITTRSPSLLEEEEGERRSLFGLCFCTWLLRRELDAASVGWLRRDPSRESGQDVYHNSGGPTGLIMCDAARVSRKNAERSESECAGRVPRTRATGVAETCLKRALLFQRRWRVG